MDSGIRQDLHRGSSVEVALGETMAYYGSGLPLVAQGTVPMPFSNLQAAILAIVVIAVLAFAAWAIHDKSRTGDSLLPDFVHGAARQ